MAGMKLDNVGSKASWVYPEVQGPERWGHSACFYQGMVYVFGGCRGGRQFSDVMRLDLSSMTWSTFPCTGQHPGARDSHTAVLHGRKMIVFGGTNGTRKINDVHVLDLETRVWTSPPGVEGQAPPARESHSATLVDDNRMVIFGGTGEGVGNFLNDIHFLELDRMKWVSPAVKGELPVCRDSHTAVAVKDQLIVYGGDCRGNRYLNEVDVFNLRTFTWSKIDTGGSPQPGVRAGHISVAVDNKVYVFGGVGDRVFYSDVWVLSLETWKWSQVEVTGRQPQGRFSHVAVVRDDDVAIYGGCGEDERPLSDVLVLHLGIEELNPDYPRCKFMQTVYDMERRRPSVEVIIDDGLCDSENKSRWKELNISSPKGTPRPFCITQEAFVRGKRLPFSLMDHLREAESRKRKTPNLVARLEGVDAEQDEVSPTMSQQPSPTISEQDKAPPTKSSRPPAIFLQHQQQQHVERSFKCHKEVHQLHLSHLQQQQHRGQLHHHHHQLTDTQPQQQQQQHHRPFKQLRTSNLVGSDVRGTIDGAFDSGYLMTAQVNGHVFRGVLFSAGPVHASPPLMNVPGPLLPVSAPQAQSGPAPGTMPLAVVPVYLTTTDHSSPRGGPVVIPATTGSAELAAAAARPVQIVRNVPHGRWVFHPSTSPPQQQSQERKQPAAAAEEPARAAPPSLFKHHRKSSEPDLQPEVTLSLGQSCHID